MAIDRKLQTESCILCDGTNCTGCCFEGTLKNNFKPNTQTESLIKDGYLSGGDLAVIHQMTMKKRVFGEEKEDNGN